MSKRTGSLGIQILHQTREKVLSNLKPLGAYLYYSAVSGSQYIKFKDPRLGSLRIGDHRGKEKYRYKWNLIAGGQRKTVKEEKYIRYYFPIGEINEMCQQIHSYRRQLLKNFGEYDQANDPFASDRSRKRDHR